MQTAFQLPVRVPTVLVIGAETEAPAAGAVLAQSSALQNILNGFLLTAVQFASDGTPSFEVAVRSSTNSDLFVWLVSPSEAETGCVVCWLPAVNGNYVQVRAKSAGSSSTYYQANIMGYAY
jgi:hypothetical protein